MDTEERLYFARCPYCGHTSGLVTTLEMYRSSFWCTRCSKSFKVDPLHPQRTIPRRKNTWYNDI